MMYLAVFGIVLAINLMPAFGPPTWIVLVILMLNWDLNPGAMVIIGGVAAGLGRYVLALAARALRSKIGERRRRNLEASQRALLGRKSGALAGLALFALSPLPSAQLFEAAGILAMPLVPLTLAFFVGRIVSYSIYVSSATLVADKMGDVFTDAFTSPFGIALQVAMLLLMVLLAEVDFAALRTKWRDRRNRH